MSAIGDYVHLTAQGYNNYGITRKKRFQGYSFDTAKDVEIEKIKAKLGVPSEASMQQLEDGLNSFFYNAKTGNSTDTEIQVMNEILQTMSNQFGEKLGNIDFSTGDIIASQEQIDASISQIRRIATEDNQDSILNQLKTKISKFNTLLPKLARSINLDESYMQIEREYQSVKAEFEALEYQIVNSEKMPKKLSNEIISKENNLIKRMNKLISSYATMPAISLQKGEFLEYLTAYITGVINDQTVAEVSETMDSVKQGGQTEDVKIEVQNFVQSFTQNGLTEKINFGKDVLTIKQSQQKIDVQVDINTEQLGASIKNVNLQNSGARIHTVSGSNLMFFLQDIEPDFANHYLNLNAMHSRPGALSKESIKDVNANMKAVMAARALTGATYGRTAANIFIVNDNKTGKVRVISMAKLVDAIADLENARYISVKLNNGKSIYEKQSFVNKVPKGDKDRTGAARISNLLNSLRSIQLSSSISGGFFINAYDSYKNSIT